MEIQNINKQSETALQPHPEFKWIDKISILLDNKFTIPFTQIKFGVDFLIGLIPTIGDWLSFCISAILVFAIVRRGVGIGMLLKMMGNITLDATVGSIPIIGDLFDLRFKANRRNVTMLKQYYLENPNPPSAKRSFFVVFLMFFAVLSGMLLLVFKLISWLLVLVVSGHIFSS